MTPNILKLLERCIEDGTHTGVHRSFKYADQPSREELIKQVVHNIMNELHEWFEFDKEHDHE